MNKGINKVILLGNLTRDPEIKVSAGGSKLALLGVATNERYKNKDGEWVDKTEYHTVALWDKLAEIAEEYLTKGSQVYVEGSLNTTKYEDKDGNTRYSTKVVGRELVLLGGKPHDEFDQRREPVGAGNNDPFGA